MMFMNEWEVERAVERFNTDEFPNLGLASRSLYRLMRWTNANSDGWAYWSKPIRAAKQLQVLLSGVDRWDPQDVTEAEVKKALVPVKAFLTRQGVDHAVVFGGK